MIKKIKGIKKVVCMTVAFVTVLVFSGVAFAANGGPVSWSSSQCLNGFTCKNPLTKTYGNWAELFVDCADADWPGHSWTPNEVLATFKTSTGLAMTEQFEAKVGGETEYDNPDHSGTNTVKLRIDNPHPGYNMVSDGSFSGFYF